MGTTEDIDKCVASMIYEWLLEFCKNNNLNISVSTNELLYLLDDINNQPLIFSDSPNFTIVARDFGSLYFQIKQQNLILSEIFLGLESDRE